MAQGLNVLADQEFDLTMALCLSWCNVRTAHCVCSCAAARSHFILQACSCACVCCGGPLVRTLFFLSPQALGQFQVALANAESAPYMPNW